MTLLKNPVCLPAQFSFQRALTFMALLLPLACVTAPAAMAQTTSVEQVSSLPTIPELTLKQFRFGVLHDSDTATPKLEQTLVVTRGNAPFGWTISLDTNKSAVRWREEFTMPVPPKSWGSAKDATDVYPMRLSADKRTATTERLVTVGRSELSHRWTLEPGDPAGLHTMRVWVEDVLVATVNFEVK